MKWYWQWVWRFTHFSHCFFFFCQKKNILTLCHHHNIEIKNYHFKTSTTNKSRISVAKNLPMNWIWNYFKQEIGHFFHSGSSIYVLTLFYWLIRYVKRLNLKARDQSSLKGITCKRKERHFCVTLSNRLLPNKNVVLTCVSESKFNVLRWSMFRFLAGTYCVAAEFGWEMRKKHSAPWRKLYMIKIIKYWRSWSNKQNDSTSGYHCLLLAKKNKCMENWNLSRFLSETYEEKNDGSQNFPVRIWFSVSAIFSFGLIFFRRYTAKHRWFDSIKIISCSFYRGWRAWRSFHSKPRASLGDE